MTPARDAALEAARERLREMARELGGDASDFYGMAEPLAALLLVWRERGAEQMREKAASVADVATNLSPPTTMAASPITEIAKAEMLDLTRWLGARLAAAIRALESD